MIQLLKDRAHNNSKILSKEHLNIFARKNTKLRTLFETAFINLESNKYINPDAEEGKVYTDAFFKKLLKMHRYLVKIKKDGAPEQVPQ